MKSLFLLTIVAFFGISAYAQPSHPASLHDTLTAKNLKVTFDRPYKKGRAIFGSLEPYGKVYRCGADEATTITFAKDGVFGGKPVKAGTYALFAIPTETKWTIILNGNAKQWGAYDYEKNKDKDVLQVEVPVKKLSAVVEQLTISAPASELIIEWDQTQVAIPFSFS